MNVMEFFQNLHMQTSAFMYIAVFVYICSSSPTDLQGFFSFLFFFSLLSPACLILKGNLSFYFHQLQSSAGVKENIAEDRRFVKQI